MGWRLQRTRPDRRQVQSEGRWIGLRNRNRRERGLGHELGSRALITAPRRRVRLWRWCTVQFMAGDPRDADTAINPFEGLSADENLVVAALRGRHRGATVASLAADAVLSQHTTLQCLVVLQARNLAESTCRRVASFHVPLLVDVWNLSNLAWKALRWMPARLKVPSCGDPDAETGLPVELWPVFWSGQRVSEFRVLADGERICEALLQAPMPEARVWALLNLPCEVLEHSRHQDEPLLRHLVAARRE